MIRFEFSNTKKQLRCIFILLLSQLKVTNLKRKGRILSAIVSEQSAFETQFVKSRGRLSL